MSQAHVRTWPNFNWSKYLWIYCITRFTLSAHCLRWPWPLTFWPQKLISTSMNPSTSVIIIGRNSFIYFRDIVFTRFFGSLPAVTLTFDLLAPKAKANQHIWTQMHMWPKLGEIPFIGPIICDKQKFLCSHHINFHECEMNHENKVNLVSPDVKF